MSRFIYVIERAFREYHIEHHSEHHIEHHSERLCPYKEGVNNSFDRDDIFSTTFVYTSPHCV